RPGHPPRAGRRGRRRDRPRPAAQQPADAGAGGPVLHLDGAHRPGAGPDRPPHGALSARRPASSPAEAAATPRPTPAVRACSAAAPADPPPSPTPPAAGTATPHNP